MPNNPERLAIKVNDGSRKFLEQITCEPIEPDITYVVFQPGGFTMLTAEDLPDAAEVILWPRFAVLSYINVIIEE